MNRKEDQEREDNVSFQRFKKWSTSTILKFIESQHWMMINETLHNPEIDREEMNRRIDSWLDTFLALYIPIYNYGLNHDKNKKS